MATTHWRTGYSVNDLYNEKDVGWSFYQLVRLLLPNQVSQDELLEHLSNYVEFASSLSQDFPAGEIRRVEVADSSAQGGNNKTKITCNNYNIAAVNGPLPEPFVEMLRDDQIQNDGAMNAFINIFNNRIQALRYLVHAFTNNNLTSSYAADTSTGQLLLSLSGHLNKEQRKFHQQTDDTYIGLAGDLANCRMNLPTIRKLLHRILGVHLHAMNSLLGRWLTVEESDHTHIGKQNHRLGSEATLGKKIWDQQAIFELVIGPLTVSRVQELVPEGKDYPQLKKLVEWISELRCDCKITLMCEPNSTNETTLSQHKNQTNSLGYGTWLSGIKSNEQSVSYMVNLAH
jgi:type VI secretion system ImpH/TssG family protein